MDVLSCEWVWWGIVRFCLRKTWNKFTVLKLFYSMLAFSQNQMSWIFAVIAAFRVIIVCNSSLLISVLWSLWLLFQKVRVCLDSFQLILWQDFFGLPKEVASRDTHQSAWLFSKHYHYVLSEPNSTSNQVGSDKLIGWPAPPHNRNF